MSGNGVADWYTDDLGKDDVKDPKGPAEGKGKVFKGSGYVFQRKGLPL